MILSKLFTVSNTKYPFMGKHNNLKTITWIFLFTFSVFMFSTCEEETEQQRSYPRLSTANVTNITEKGVTFKGIITSPGTEIITEQGFIWGTTASLSISTSDRIFLGPGNQSGDFTADIHTTLVKGLNYYVRPFVQTADHMVYGPIASFKSLGSEAPQINGFEPNSVFWGDTLCIKGKNFSWITNNNVVRLNTLECYVFNSTDTTINILIPYDLVALKSALSVELSGNSVAYTKDSLKLLTPFFSFSPKEATWGDYITLTGVFNSVYSRNSVQFDNINSTIYSVYFKQLKVRVPDNLSKEYTNIIYKCSPFTIVSAETFHLKGPEIKSFTPISGAGGTLMTINGKYFHKGNTTVSFGNTNAEITSMNDSTIVLKVPSGITGDYTISVKVFQQTASSDLTFKVTNPKITTIYPLTGTFNDEITIEGENLSPASGSPTVTFGTISAIVKSFSDNSIVALVPTTIDSIPRTIKVNAGSSYGISTDVFTLDPPEISSVTPADVLPGNDITITGKNFSPVASGDSVKWDIYSLPIKSATSTEIVATFPEAIPRGTFKIKVKTGGYTRYSSQEFTINSQWLRIPAPAMSTNSTGSETFGLMSIYGEGVGNYGYLCSPASNVMYKFDPSGASWAKINTLNEFYLKAKMGEVVCRDTFYLISGQDYTGYNNSLYMYKFNETQNGWETIKNTPFNDRTGVAFSLNNKIYFGLNYSPYSYFHFVFDIWECDPVNGYLWTRKSDFPSATASYPSYSSYFSLADKGYVVFSNNQVWQYDPIGDTWTQKSNFPGPKRGLAISFVIGEYAYFGTGNYNDTYYNDIWRYNSANDSWSLVSYMPVARRSAVALTINNKAYIGYGIASDNGTQYVDFYEFDPNY